MPFMQDCVLTYSLYFLNIIGREHTRNFYGCAFMRIENCAQRSLRKIDTFPKLLLRLKSFLDVGDPEEISSSCKSLYESRHFLCLHPSTTIVIRLHNAFSNIQIG